MREAGARHRERTLAQHVVHDREIVDRQVPQDVDVLLEQTEIDADGIVVVDLAELARLGELFHLANRAGVDEGVAHHQHEVAGLRLVDQTAGFVAARRDRLFDQHVLAGAQRRQRQIEVRLDGRRDDDGIDIAGRCTNPREQS